MQEKYEVVRALFYGFDTRSHLSRTIRRFLRQNGYPSDKQNLNVVVELLMKQAEALSQDWNIA